MTTEGDITLLTAAPAPSRCMQELLWSDSAVPLSLP